MASIVDQLNKWIRNNVFTVLGTKYINTEAFVNQVKKLENITNETHAVKRASFLKIKYLNTEGIEFLKTGRGDKVKALGEALDKNPEFKAVYKTRHGSVKIGELTRDQLKSLEQTFSKLVRHAEIIPAGAITEAEFLKRIGLTKGNVDSLRTSAKIKISPRGKKFNELFKPVVLKNKATYYDVKGLSENIKKYHDFMDQEFVSDKGIERANKFKNSKAIQKYLDGKNNELWAKKGRAKALEVLGKGTTPWQASHAMSALARAYDGDKLRGIDVTPNKAKADFIFKNLTNLKERDRWSAPVYNQGLRQVNKELTGVGNFRTFKDTYTDKMNEIFDDMKIPKKYRTSINEIVSIKGAYRNQMAPYAAFVDLTRSDLNRYIAQHQGSLSAAMKYLEKYKDDQAKFQRKIKLFNEQTLPKGIANVTREFGPEAAKQVRLASLVGGTDVESVYSKADLERWAKKGLDLKKMAKEKRYFIDVKGARPFFDVTIEDLKKAVRGLSEKEKIRYCSLLSNGGLPGKCAKAIESNVVKSSQIFSEAPATSGAMTKVKNIATTFLRTLGRVRRESCALCSTCCSRCRYRTASETIQK